jgi:predicted nucleic acid-binding protein
MIVVCDSTPLIYLAALGKFDLLQTLYRHVSIPTAVYDEVVIQGAGRWGAAETAQASWSALF